MRRECFNYTTIAIFPAAYRRSNAASDSLPGLDPKLTHKTNCRWSALRICDLSSCSRCLSIFSLWSHSSLVNDFSACDKVTHVCPLKKLYKVGPTPVAMSRSATVCTARLGCTNECLIAHQLQTRSIRAHWKRVS